MKHEISVLPEMSSLSWQAFKTFRRKPGREIVLPDMTATYDRMTFDPARLAAYREICGFGEDSGVPITYPQVHAIAVQMVLLTRPQFPLPLLGLVHLRNAITQSAPLDPDGTYDVSVSVGASEQTDRGLEFVLVTKFATEDGEVPWRAEATVLYRGTATGRKARRSEPPPPPPARYLTFDAPEDIGRRYARISGDSNPIHLHPWSARLFGFKRHIAHGMWSLARCAALLQPGLEGPPVALEARFLQPLYLPARLSVRHLAGPEGIGFTLLGQRDGRPHLAGTLR